MSTVFKTILYLGVAVSVAGFVLPYFADEPSIRDSSLVAQAGGPSRLRFYLSFGGLGLMALGLVGRSATRKTETQWK